MALYPEIVAGYGAALAILDGTGVTVNRPDQQRVDYDDPMALVASFPAAYSVDAMVLPEGVNVGWNGRFGINRNFEMVPYPVPHTHPDFQARLHEVLVPAVERAQQAAAAEREQQTATSPDGPHEATDAVKRIS